MHFMAVAGGNEDLEVSATVAGAAAIGATAMGAAVAVAGAIGAAAAVPEIVAVLHIISIELFIAMSIIGR